jgi:prevent-host-death family protein
MVESLTTVEARNQFSALINRVAYGNERIVLTRRGRKPVAVVSIHDLQRVMSLDAPADPRMDPAEYLAAEVGRVLGLKTFQR